MLTVLGSRHRSANGFTRRETLKAGALGMLGGFTLPQLLAAEERRGAQRPGRAKSVAFGQTIRLCLRANESALAS